MTAKQALQDLLDRMTEEEASTFVARLHANGALEFEPLTPEQRASVERGMAQTDAGLSIPHQEVMRRSQRLGAHALAGLPKR